MKTFSAMLIAVAFAAFTLPAGAASGPNDILNLKAKVVDYQNIVVQLTNLAQKNTIFSLRNFSGDTHYRELIKNHNGYRLLLDLSQLPEGKYILSAWQKGSERQSQVLRVTEKGILLSEPYEE